MIKSLLDKNYLLYGSSIVISRGMEYFILFFAAHQLTKSDYGELEYYKKVIEVGSSIFAFGFPALIISYTKSKDSKHYFFLLGILFVFALSIISIIFFSFFNWSFLIVPFVFYAVFFTGGIAQSYFLVYKGSNFAASYKIFISIIFYIVVFISIYYFGVKGNAFVYVNYILLPLSIIHVLLIYRKEKIELKKLKKYWTLFKKLLLSSFTLVVSNFATIMFLYTDIFVIKILSKSPNVDIANFSFALNVASILLIVPLTLIQVDIEKLKKVKDYIFILNKKIIVLLLIGVVALIILYHLIINNWFLDYKETFSLFLIILLAKTFQAYSNLFGTNLIIFKKFRQNLFINLSILSLNVFLSYFMFTAYGLIGVAISSVVSLGLLNVLLFRMNRKLNYKKVNF